MWREFILMNVSIGLMMIDVKFFLRYGQPFYWEKMEVEFLAYI